MIASNYNFRDEHQAVWFALLLNVAQHILGLYQGEPGARGFRRLLSEGARLPGVDWSLIETALAPFRQAA